MVDEKEVEELIVDKARAWLGPRLARSKDDVDGKIRRIVEREA